MEFSVLKNVSYVPLLCEVPQTEQVRSACDVSSEIGLVLQPHASQVHRRGSAAGCGSSAGCSDDLLLLLLPCSLPSSGASTTEKSSSTDESSMVSLLLLNNVIMYVCK